MIGCVASVVLNCIVGYIWYNGNWPIGKFWLSRNFPGQKEVDHQLEIGINVVINIIRSLLLQFILV